MFCFSLYTPVIRRSCTRALHLALAEGRRDGGNDELLAHAELLFPCMRHSYSFED